MCSYMRKNTSEVHKWEKENDEEKHSFVKVVTSWDVNLFILSCLSFYSFTCLKFKEGFRVSDDLIAIFLPLLFLLLKVV